MAVYCRQVADDVEQTLRIAPHSEVQTEEELLRVKAKGASDKGWDVTWTGDRSFTATKTRWGDVLCTRSFWIE